MKKILVLFLCSAILLTGCSISKKEEPEKIPLITTTNYITYTVTKAIVGNTAKVTYIDISPEQEITPKILRTLRSSSVIIYTNDTEEPWVKNCINNELDDSGIKIISAAKGLKEYPIKYKDNLFTQNMTVPSNPENPAPPKEPENPKPVKPVKPVKPEKEEIERNEEQQKIREELDDLDLYDSVNKSSVLNDILSEKRKSSNKDSVKFAFEGNLYIFGYSQNKFSFFLIEVQKLNAMTEVPVDPYYWLSFDNMKLIADNINDSLNLIIDKEHSVRNQNCEKYKKAIDELKEEYNSYIPQKGTINILDCYIPQILIDEFDLHYSCLCNNMDLTDKNKLNYYNYLIRNKVTNSLFSTTGEDLFIENEKFKIEKFNTLKEVEDMEKSYFSYMKENLECLKKCIK